MKKNYRYVKVPVLPRCKYEEHCGMGPCKIDYTCDDYRPIGYNPVTKKIDPVAQWK